MHKYAPVFINSHIYDKKKFEKENSITLQLYYFL